VGGRIVSYDPAKRDSSWRMIEPGCYIDPAGRGHIFPDEVVAYLQTAHPEAGFNFSREDYDLIVETFVAMMRAHFQDINVQFIRHTRESV
jgi:hypothetical protein